MTSSEIKKALLLKADKRRIESLAKFFQVFPGGYGYGDLFIGISYSAQKPIVARFAKMPLEEVEQLLHEPYHEYRSAALQIMVTRFKPKRSTERQAIVDMYLRNLDYVNNWDLVDLSAHKILGPWLQDKDRSILYELARSKNIWHQRVAMVTTLHFIRSLDFEDTFKLAEILLHTPDDIIQKAVGWMLKEISKKDLSALLPFLDKYYREMPRTMLRYAIEKFEPELRKHYMKKINT